jgi:hemoglobin-like flavoprotein
MCITDDELDLLRHGLRVMLSRKELAADVFYANLFALAPQTRPMFGEDIIGQTEKVMFAFGAVVGQIHDLDACRGMTRELAIRHVSYGVVAGHCALVGQAVMRTLEMVLDDDFSPAMDAAWRKAYDAIAAAMVSSAYPAEIAAAFGQGMLAKTAVQVAAR